MQKRVGTAMVNPSKTSSIVSWASLALSRYARDARANVAMIFALCVLPLFFVAGFAIDTNRQMTYQNKVQNALDFAVLSTARHALTTSATDGELEQVAQDFFDAEFTGMGEATLTPVSFARAGDLVTLEVSGTLPTAFMQLAGTKTMPLGTTSEAVFGEPSRAEIALVLDTSYSMNGSRLSTLETAANSMIDKLVVADSDAIKMSIVPFATYVNVGLDKEGESWLQVEADQTTTGESCYIEGYNDWRRENCERVSYSCTRDGVERTCTRWDCDDADEPAPTNEICTTTTSTSSWQGCVESRSAPHNVEDTSYNTKPVVGFRSWSGLCPSPIQELTNDPAVLKAKVSALNANQNTYIATGLTWGLRTLTPGAPFDEGAPFADFFDQGGRKALVLMSDGANTRSPSTNGKHNDTNVTNANDITEDVCDEIKSYQIELYTIAFELDDLATKALLEGCATSSDYYYDASNSAELEKAFDNIGSEFRDIALAR